MSEDTALESKICTRCIMDNSDPSIEFDDKGFCNYCQNYDNNIFPYWMGLLKDNHELNKLTSLIKSDRRNTEFDCIIGLSGGLDSSYAAHIAVKKMGLKPLLYHVDAGWNTDQAVGNIEKLIDGLGLDLYTDVINWEELKQLHVAFFKSGIPDLDLVQDAMFFSSLYKFARKNRIKHVITGSNFSTECCREPEEWGGYLGIDRLLFNDIWSRFGKGDRKSLPLIDIITYKIWYQKIIGMRIHHPLNLIQFNKLQAENELESLYGWKRFKHKHHESRFTRFYEDYWLPKRFGFEKRRAHFSSLIMTGQMTREDALVRISKSEMGDKFLNQEFEYVAHKLDLEESDLQGLFDLPKKTYKDYRNKRWLILLGANLLRRLGLEKRYFH